MGAAELGKAEAQSFGDAPTAASFGLAPTTSDLVALDDAPHHHFALAEETDTPPNPADD
jgi:hypothetical protein